MIQSMTGFGRGEASGRKYKLEMEMKSVNHRYLDISVRLPRRLNFCESLLRRLVKDSVQRGKVDVFVSFSAMEENISSIHWDKKAASAYLDGIRAMSRELKLEDTTVAYDIACLPDVFRIEEGSLDEEEIQQLICTAMEQSLKQFLGSRAIEGEKLQEDIRQKLDTVLSLVDSITARSPEIVQEYRQKITAKVEELLGDTQVDDRVLATELVVFADKSCVDEELVRLRTHVLHMRETIEQEKTVGRKLDFLTQEMNREANTILSKTTDIEISNCGIELKTEIEKIREQIQNIE